MRTDVGRRRHNNEDSYLVADQAQRVLNQLDGEGSFSLELPGTLLAVADGMGGHSSGEVASRLCVEGLAAEYANLGELPSDVESVGRGFREAVERVNQSIFRTAGDQPAYAGMGTTLTAALVRGHDVWVAQVGDSRAYLLREGQLHLLTEDQTLGNLMKNGTGVTLEVYAREMLTQAVGSQSEIDVVVTHTEVGPGDLLLICCDGLYKVVSDADVTARLVADDSLHKRMESLVDLALERGGPDNVTTILAKFVA